MPDAQKRIMKIFSSDIHAVWATTFIIDRIELPLFAMKSRHLVGQTVCASKREHHRSMQHSRFYFYVTCSHTCTHSHRRHLVGQIIESCDVIFNTVYCLGVMDEYFPPFINN